MRILGESPLYLISLMNKLFHVKMPNSIFINIIAFISGIMYYLHILFYITIFNAQCYLLSIKAMERTIGERVDIDPWVENLLS